MVDARLVPSAQGMTEEEIQCAIHYVDDADVLLRRIGVGEAGNGSSRFIGGLCYDPAHRREYLSDGLAPTTHCKHCQSSKTKS